MQSPLSANRFQPLRKPLTSPLSLTAGAPQLRPPAKAESAPACRGDVSTDSADSNDVSAPPQSSPSGLPALTVVFCNYCGQQANSRCNSCKKVPYCSVACQKEDWKSHKHSCTYVEKTRKALSNESIGSPPQGSRPTLIEMKRGSPQSSHKVYLKDLPIPEFVEGGDIQASVLEFYSPSSFFIFVQRSEMLEALTSITSELQRLYSLPSASSYVPSAGEVCAVQFSCDLKWYRGLIKTLAHDQKMANVLYIDFGNEEDVPVDRIRSLAANLKPFHPCAVECCIAGVLPADDTWSSECCTAVRSMVMGSVVTVCLVKTPEHGRSYAVDVLLPVGKLSTVLVDFGYAKKEIANQQPLTPTKQEIDAMTNASLENFRRLSDGKDDNSWAQPPEPLTQAVGDCLSVVVIHFQSPTDFIVQKVDSARVIQDLQLKLKEHCSQVAAPKNFRPAPGTVCCAQFSEDKQWYRAKILAYSSEERVCVGYIDFGNSEEVDLSHLRPINTSLLELPMQVIPCGLAGVQPIGETWSEDCIAAFQSCVSNRILKMEIQGAQDGKVLVAMNDEASDPQANVAELLISVGYAAPAPALAPVDTTSASQADQTAPPLQSKGSPPVCEPLVWHQAELPCDGQTVALRDIFVENPGEFYCCISSPADQQQFIELGAQLKLHCEADATSFVPKVGEPCCAMYSGDGTWRRAMVKGVSADCVRVNFVDHGSSMMVETSHVRSITPKLLKLPFQSVRCWLAGVEPLDSEWSSESLLFFLTLIDGQELSARVVSVSERGFGVELESQGQSVADALISENLARVPGELAKETHVNTSHSHKDVDEANKLDQVQVQTSSQMEATCKEMLAVSSGEPSFPVDWKAVALPFNLFKPNVAAAINPSLFYVLGPVQGDGKNLRELMERLGAYCCKHQVALAAAVRSRPAPGAACCAQFSADNNWYRAVVLQVCDNEVKVIYADYGNMETVPFSRILPIPQHLLQLPFQITRCTLLGQQQFPAVWPEEVVKVFEAALSSGVFAAVHSFDGLANTLSLTLPTESGEENVSSIILDALRNKTHDSPPAALKSEQTPDLLGRDHKTQSGLKDVTAESQSSEDRAASLEQKKHSAAAAAATHEDGVKRIVNQMEPPWQSNSKFKDQKTLCCCLSLKTQMDRMEQLIQQQLSLIKQLVGQTQ